MQARDSRSRFLITGGSGFIGTNLVDALSQTEVDICNIDKKKPLKASHLPYWQACNILDLNHFRETFHAFSPTHVIHLAARTDTDGTSIDQYRDNTDGTANLLSIVRDSLSCDRVIITSTQFVRRPGALPSSDEDYDPHTVYGSSKVICEQLTRQAELPCVWTIIRPTNIWGPWHPRYPNEFWRVLRKGVYIHPGKQPVIRSYGYIGNVVDQVRKILFSDHRLVNGKVFYVGDKPINLLEWVNGFSLALTGKKVRIVPRAAVYSLALIGDRLKPLGIRFPLTTTRFASMTQDYPTPMEPTLRAFGEGPYSLGKGIEETVGWLTRQSTSSV
jgi:nucleoside-diphosphate-sugar epimerase